MKKTEKITGEERRLAKALFDRVEAALHARVPHAATEREDGVMYIVNGRGRRVLRVTGRMVYLLSAYGDMGLSRLHMKSEADVTDMAERVVEHAEDRVRH